MSRPRSEAREIAFQLWLKSNGEIKLVDLAEKLGVPDSKIRKWKAVDKWDQKLKGETAKSGAAKGAIQKPQGSDAKKGSDPNKGKGSAPKRPGAPKGSKNALGNRGGHGGPPGNKKTERHGFFSRIFPDDPETQAIIDEIGIKSPLDILWENIVIQYTAIVRAQKIMFVKDKEDLTKTLKREKETSGLHSDGWEKEWELQYAWDKQASFLQAQSRAIRTLESLVARYDGMLPGALQYEEQRLRVEKLKVEIAAFNTPDDGSLAELAQAIRESEAP